MTGWGWGWGVMEMVISGGGRRREFGLHLDLGFI